jgi:hypothetical protein
MLAPLLAVALAAAPRVAVLPVVAGQGVPPGTAAAVAEAVAGEVRRRAGVEVITQREIAAVMSLERQKEMLGCKSDSCMAELGGALGCDRLVAGDLARLGESWLISLKLVETGKARVSAQADRRLRGGTIDDVLDQLPAMVAELFPGGAAGSPLTARAVAAARPAIAPGLPTFAEEPIPLAEGDRARLAGWADEAGRIMVTIPFSGMDAPFYWGDATGFHLLRIRGGGQQGDEVFDRAFWEPRARVPAEAIFEVRDGKATLTCGERTITLRKVPAAELEETLKGARFLAPRWRRIPHALARDDEGTYYYVDGTRGPDGAALGKKPGYQLWTGRKGKLVRQELEDALVDGAGQLYVGATGRLRIKPTGRDTAEATWLTAAGSRPLTWLEPSDHGPLIYGELGVYAGERLGTPCDGRF